MAGSMNAWANVRSASSVIAHEAAIFCCTCSPVHGWMERSQ
jgi:hypothetical protein